MPLRPLPLACLLLLGALLALAGCEKKEPPAPAPKAEAVQARPAVDLTGTWEAESLYSDGRRKAGELKIVQSGAAVTATSETGHSTWSGTFDGETLQATYKREKASGKLTLKLLPPGDVLQGTWQSDGGPGGSFTAKRKKT
jgi:hypothetical protein